MHAKTFQNYILNNNFAPSRSYFISFIAHFRKHKVSEPLQANQMPLVSKKEIINPILPNH